MGLYPCAMYQTPCPWPLVPATFKISPPTSNLNDNPEIAVQLCSRGNCLKHLEHRTTELLSDPGGVPIGDLYHDIQLLENIFDTYFF